MGRSSFIKSADTSTSAINSRGELERLLRRYGCTGFGVTTDYTAGRVSVTFRVPDTQAKDAPQVPVRLDVDITATARSLYGHLLDRNGKRWMGGKGYVTGFTEKELAQAERVAWRHLILWIDAACSAAAAGMQTMTEAFFAHLLVRDEQGQVGRMVDYVRTLGGDAAVQRALPAGGTGG